MNWRIPVASGAVAGLCGLALLIGPAPTTAGPQIAGGPDTTAPLLKAGIGNRDRFGRPDLADQLGNTTRDSEGGGVIGCHYDNLRLGEPAMGFALAQKSVDPNFPPFYAETADDFVLTDPADPDSDSESPFG